MDALMELDQIQTDMAHAQRLTGEQAAQELARLHEVLQRWTMVTRARAVADWHYLDGVSQRDIARQLGMTVNAVSLWLKKFGPKQYVTLREDDGSIVVELVPAKSAKQLAEAGRRVVPATEGLYEAEGETGEVRTFAGRNVSELWHRLASQS